MAQVSSTMAQEERGSEHELYSSDSDEWDEPEDSHPCNREKRGRSSSPDNNRDDESAVRSPCRHKKACHGKAQRSLEPSVVELSSDSVAASSASESQRLKQKRKGRTQNKMPVGPFVVELVDDDGDPLVPEGISIKARHACGCLVRDNCRIIYDDWRKVPESEKEIMWTKWLQVFHVPKGTEGRARTWTMRQCGISLRNWRSELNRDYVQTGLEPFETFKNITQVDWDTFVEKKTHEKALKVSKERSEQAKKNVHHHTMGSSGYKGKIPKWRKEIKKAVKAGKENPYDKFDERTVNWMFGRRSVTSTNGDLTFSRPETQEVAQKLAKLQEQVEEGSFVPVRQHDTLTEALGTKEHPGRTRGLGTKVPWRDGFPRDRVLWKCRREHESRSKHEQSNKEEKHEQWNKEEMKQVFVEFYHEMKAQEHEQQRLTSPHGPSSAGSDDSVEPPGTFPVDSITVPTRCKLYVPTGKADFNIEVASAVAYPGRIWHNSPIPDKYAKVSCFEVHSNCVDYKLDIPTKDTKHDTLGEAKDEFILWPRRDIRLDEPISPVAHSQRVLAITASSPLCQSSFPPSEPARERSSRKQSKPSYRKQATQ